MKQVCFSVYNLAKFSLFEDTCHGTKAEQQFTVLFIYNEEGSDKLPL
jgi:hypothetical protein